MVYLARLVASRREAEVWTDILGSAKPCRDINSRVESHGGERANPGHPHPPTADVPVPRSSPEGSIKRGDLLVDFRPGAEQGLEGKLQRRELRGLRADQMEKRRPFPGRKTTPNVLSRPRTWL